MKIVLLVTLLLAAAVGWSPETDAPGAEITNGQLKARVLLPDTEKGYYRGTRFDWSGVVSSLNYNGHSFFGKWFDTYNPTLHDAIMGPVEEFGPLGFDETGVGDSFVKIGIGALTRPDDKPYDHFRPYTISNNGLWEVKKKADQVQFRHTLNDSKYAYSYQKTLKLIKGKPEMVITHSLKNTGKLPIETTCYNHNFFMIDQQPTGPTYSITFPIGELSAEEGRGVVDVVTLKDSQLGYQRELNKNEHVYFPNLSASKPIPYQLTVANTKAGAGVHITGDQPITKMVYWSSWTTVCPEPYITIRVAPGKTFNWQIKYQYYVDK